METNYPAVICQGKQQRGSGGPGQAGDKQPSQATLFMAFLCISVFIWTFLSWRAGLLPSCMPQHLHSAGYLPLGLLGRELALARVATAVGTPGLASVSLGGSLQACPGLLLHSQRGGAGWECQGELLVPGGWGREGYGGPCREQGGREAPRRAGAGGHWELCPRASIAPCSRRGALCQHRPPVRAPGPALLLFSPASPGNYLFGRRAGSAADEAPAHPQLI